MAQISGGGAGSGGAIAIGTYLEDTPVVQGVSNIIGSLGGLTTALGVASAAMAGLITQDAIQEITQFETELADLAKVLGNREMARPIAESIAELSTEMPIARQELSAIAEQAVRFGIRGRDNIMEFTRAVAEMSVATDATADEAAEAMVKIAAVTQEPVSEIRRMGDVLNRLSNTAATSFSELITSAGKMAPMLSQMDVNTEDIFALAAATNEVNISVRRGSRRLRSFFQNIRQTSTLESVAQAMGTTADELTRMADEGEGLELLIAITQQMQKGGKEARQLTNALTNAASQGAAALSQNLRTLIFKHLPNAREEMKEGGSLSAEYAQRVNTAAAKQQLLNNQIDEAQRQLGKDLLPKYKSTLDLLIQIADALDNFGRTGKLEQVLAGENLDEIRDSLEGIVNAQSDFVEDASERFQFGGESVESISRFMGQLADMFGEGGEAAREAWEQAFFDNLMRVPSQNRGQFVSAAREIFKSFEAQGEDVDFSAMEQALSTLTLALSQAEEEGDQFQQKMEEISLPTGEFADFKAEHADLLRNFRQETREMGRTETEILKLNLGYKNLSEAQKEVVDQILAQRRAREENIESIKEAKQEIVGLADAYISLGQDAIKRFMEQSETFSDVFADQQQEIIKLKEGELEARLHEIDQMQNLEEWQKRILKQRARMIHRLNQESEATEEAATQQERLNEQIRDMKLLTKESQLDFLEDAARNISDAFMDMFENIIDGSESAGDALVNMIQRVATELAERQLRAFIFETLLDLGGFIGGGGGGGSKVNPAAGLETPQFAAKGASANPGQLFVVGEEGPEFFVPNVAGNIVPPDKMAAAGGGKTEVKVEQTYTIQALDSRDVARVMDEHAQRIAANTVREISHSQALRRGLG